MVNIGADGIKRTKTQEQNINKLFSEVFNNESGAELLRYLRSVTIEMVAGPDVNPNSLVHLEGQRYIVGLMERRLERSKQ